LLLPIRTMWPNPSHRDWFRNETGVERSESTGAFKAAKIASIERRTALFARTVCGMGVQPFLVPEKGAKRQRNLAMLVAFRAGRE
jgi:hypothetical protein